MLHISEDEHIHRHHHTSEHHDESAGHGKNEHETSKLHQPVEKSKIDKGNSLISYRGGCDPRSNIKTTEST